jgi:hypothetical protein
VKWSLDDAGKEVIFETAAHVVGMSEHAAGAGGKSNVYHARFGDGTSLVIDLLLRQEGGTTNGDRGSLAARASARASVRVSTFFFHLAAGKNRVSPSARVNPGPITRNKWDRRETVARPAARGGLAGNSPPTSRTTARRARWSSARSGSWRRRSAGEGLAGELPGSRGMRRGRPRPAWCDLVLI